MNFEDDAMSEVAEAILSIKEPYLDLSDPEKLQEQTRPIEEYFDVPPKKFPLAIVWIDGEAYNQVANDRFEIALYFRISLIYKIAINEKKPQALSRGKNCLRQIYRRIKERQTSGDAKTTLYDYTGIQDIKAVNHDTNPDGNDEICIVSGQITLNQFQMEETC